MLELKNIYKTFNAGTVNEKQALKGIDLTLEDGDFVTVIGGNGAGKSTMLNAIAGVWPVDEGQIIIDGKDVTKLPEHKRAAFLGRVFQELQPLWELRRILHWHFGVGSPEPSAQESKPVREKCINGFYQPLVLAWKTV